ncbi:hypothetical protein BCAR13_270025 [Paraburkholderia caribensis]|nr:hypothetical protein BCAR13_270025 [Paraburkholderia caribensis]
MKRRDSASLVSTWLPKSKGSLEAGQYLLS